MKWALTIIATVLIFDTAYGQTSSSKKSSQEVSFEDLLVEGKYHFSDEAVVTVEDDKILDALLGVRRDFKDKIEQSASRN